MSLVNRRGKLDFHEGLLLRVFASEMDRSPANKEGKKSVAYEIYIKRRAKRSVAVSPESQRLHPLRVVSDPPLFGLESSGAGLVSVAQYLGEGQDCQGILDIGLQILWDSLFWEKKTENNLPRSICILYCVISTFFTDKV